MLVSTIQLLRKTYTDAAAIRAMASLMFGREISRAEFNEAWAKA